MKATACVFAATALVVLCAPLAVARVVQRPDTELLARRVLPSATTRVVLDTSALISRTGDRFMCWNIDLTDDRQFFQRDLSDPQLGYFASQLAPSTLRVGGTGADELTYTLDTDDCKADFCMNKTLWDNLNLFNKRAGSRMVFGLNITPRNGSQWDPTNARSLLEYAIANDNPIWGFELGNERNWQTKASQQAADTLILQQLIRELYKDANTRPYILGPDPHSFTDTVSRWSGTAAYLDDYMTAAAAIGLDLFAVTHHEYVQTNVTESLKPERLDLTRRIADVFMPVVRKSGRTAEPWAGEIGPHNGGSPPCSPDYTRWANFANSFWYVDAMGTTAAAGYAAFCRQDFVGIDYGLLDCPTQQPLPDYYMALLWTRLMGRGVLSAKSPSDYVRTYAHCTPANDGGVTMVLINLNNATVGVDVDVKGNGDAPTKAVAYQLTTPDTTGPVAVLNGVELEVTSDGKLPEIKGAVSTASPLSVSLPPLSISFVQWPDLGVKACQ